MEAIGMIVITYIMYKFVHACETYPIQTVEQ